MLSLGKIRRLGISSFRDKAMQSLWYYALEPIEECLGDRKSFAFRKNRSCVDAYWYLRKELEKPNAPEYMLVFDVENYYESISHSWVLEHIPMNPKVLFEFLKSKVICDGEIFPSEVGISLGNTLSPVIGNMVLDGLQKELYEVQRKENSTNGGLDYSDGYLIRFADDGVVLARSSKRAMEYLAVIEKFLEKRGLKLNQKKTQLMPLGSGIDFLSRRYRKVEGKVVVEPSKKAVEQFCNGILCFLTREGKNLSQRKMIQKLNQKIYGFAYYHKCADCEECFAWLDLFMNQAVLDFMRDKYPQTSIQRLKQKYWFRLADGKEVFCLVKDKRIRLVNFSDCICSYPVTFDVRKNIFLDRTYFKDLQRKKKVQNVTGKEKSLWNREEGLCFYCGQKLKKEEQKEVVSIPGRNVCAYVHSACLENEVVFEKGYNLEKRWQENIKGWEKKQQERQKESNGSEFQKKSKFFALEEYLKKQDAKRMYLSFSKLEEILEFSLCSSAYLYTTYWYKKEKGSMQDICIKCGYGIAKVDLQRKRIVLERERKCTLFLPTNAKLEWITLQKYIWKKYGITKEWKGGGCMVI